jgi:hypothetical protein
MVGDGGERIGGDARSSPFLAMVDKEDVGFTIGSSTSRGLLVFINAHRKFRKRTDTIMTFTQEYSKVSYLSTGK